MRISRLLVLVFGLVTSGFTHAEWALNAKASELSFISTKNNAVAETHYFRNLEGTITKSGEATLRVSLAGVDTAIAIRDERMREFLFEVGRYAHATLKATVEQLPSAGNQALLDVPLSLSLHGITANVTASLDVRRLSENRLVVSTRRPVLIHARDFGLLDGIERLREIAGLTSISPVVPVSASLVFQRE